MTTTALGSFGPPALENYFNLNIGDEYGMELGAEGMKEVTIWTNPHVGRAITPYIPENSSNFSETSQSDFLNHDVLVIILSKLDLKNVLNSSFVCKRFYSATKADFVWQVQVCKFLPNVTVIAPPLTIFCPEQQFKIIYKRIHNECKPYNAKFEHNQEMCLEKFNKLKTLEIEFQKVGGNEANQRYSQKLLALIQDGMSVMDDCYALMNSTESKASELLREIQSVRANLEAQQGANYDGTVQSIDPNSSQGLLRNAITVLVPNAFNNQAKFEAEIRKAEAASNTNSSNSSAGPLVEDVTDIEDRTDGNRS